MKPIDVSDQDFEKIVVASEKPVVLRFWANWCGPCKMIKPVFDEAASDYGYDVKFANMDVDSNRETPARFGIRGIPTLMIFSGGDLAATKVGALSSHQFKKFIDTTIYTDDEDAQDKKSEQSDSKEIVGIALVKGKLKVIGLAPDGRYKIRDDEDALHHLVTPYSLDAMAFKRAIEELEDLINDRKAREHDFQEFFEKYPDFILNDEYRAAHSKIVLERENDGPLIPDFILQPADQQTLCDLLELKTPTAEVFVLKKNRIRFSAAVMEAAAQLREYSAYFDERENRRRIEEKYGLTSYRPRMFVILGRSGKVSPIELRKAETDLPGVHLRTYDDVLMRAKRLAYKRELSQR